MPNLSIPDEGLVVPGPTLQVPDEKPNGRAAYAAPFAVKINVTERFLEELSAGKLNSLQLNTGKGRTSLQVGSNQFEFMHTLELFHNELYRQSNDGDGTVVPLGMLRDKLELLEVVEKKSADADLIALKQQMEAIKKQKDKKSVQLVSNPSKLGPELSGRRGLIAAKKAGILTPSAMKTKVNSRTKFSNSMPTSPALTATNSPAGKDVTSAPKPKSFRKDPLFLPLIHLLALGPEKEQTLAMKTHTDLDKCSSLVIQVANRDISGRWELFDQMYKELDIWKFKYPKPEMRESAIENAEDAFDRLKLAEDAPEWEMLRKPEDRGKPRPPRQPRRKPELEPPVPKKKAAAAAASPALPPTIKISKDEAVLTGSPIFTPEPMTRSISQPTSTTTTKRGNAESNALKKIIGGKKAAAKSEKATAKSAKAAGGSATGTGSGVGGSAATTKAAATKEKKAAAATAASSSTPLPSTSSTSSTTTTTAAASALTTAASALQNNSKTTISSRSPLPAASSSAPSSTRAKPAPRARGEFKSAEFISDSDSDDDRMAIDTPPPPPSQKTVNHSASSSSSSSSSSSAQPLYKKSAKAKAAPVAESRTNNIPSKRPPGVPITGKQETSISSSSAANGHKRTASMSASPAKPSPLGSSPPMTASELARQSSTASSSPLSSIATPDDVSTPMMDLHTSYTSAPTHTPKSSTEKASSKPRYVPEHNESPSPQHKRRVEDAPAASSKSRKRILSTASEESDASRKRKAPEEERPVVARKAPKTSATSEATKARKGPVKTVANGVSKKEFDKVIQTRKDIPRATYASSTTSTTSNISSSSSDSSSRGGYSKTRYADRDLALLARYKRLHDDYRARYERVRADPNAPEERIQQAEASNGDEDGGLDIPDLPSPPIFPNRQTKGISLENASITKKNEIGGANEEQKQCDPASIFTPSPSPEPEPEAETPVPKSTASPFKFKIKFSKANHQEPPDLSDSESSSSDVESETEDEDQDLEQLAAELFGSESSSEANSGSSSEADSESSSEVDSEMRDQDQLSAELFGSDPSSAESESESDDSADLDFDALEMTKEEAEEERKRRKLIRQLNWTPSPPPEERERLERERKKKEEENKRRPPQWRLAIEARLESRAQTFAARERAKELAKEGIKVPVWETTLDPPPPPTTIESIIKRTRKHTKNWLQAQFCMNKRRPPRPKSRKPKEKRTDGVFFWPNCHPHTTMFSYNRYKHGDSEELNWEDFDRPLFAEGNRRTRNVVTKTSFPNTPRYRRKG
ncbi:hypothetical protein H072_3497 [Dactylellina haptotyla CBS 200.50]|uniref:Uncharacterized protein n=1 Tax=Dactylellina haptotyla (strain CBS 200.50) TaxID=1284197 RepID=S8BSQ9_DACHA|nr:hypothetical protein H072_3497 [Dactylellina haptotyla CBS 200.50]